MALQFKLEEDSESESPSPSLPKGQEPVQYTENKQDDDLLDLIDTAFKTPSYARSIYNRLCQEYNIRITPRHAHITKAKGQFPPYWNDELNRPDELPLSQHNVNSGRYNHAICQISLTYNSFFPNEAYAKSLIELKIVKNPFGVPEKPKEESRAKKDKSYVPEQSNDESQTMLRDKSCYISQAYDNLIKNESWAKAEHLKMVSDMIHYSLGVYFYENPKSYKYKSLDPRKIRFPSGTTINPGEWEYVFIEHDMTFSELAKKYKAANPDSDQGWNKRALGELLKSILAGGSSSLQTANGVDRIESVDNIREGFTGIDYGKVAGATVPVVSVYWRQDNDKVGVATFSASNGGGSDAFLFQKDNHADSFADIFSIFPADETENEIRMIRGWGEKIHPLCHAYDRAFCRFLDHMGYASTMFVNIDPNDLHKKILHFGSMNVGKIDSIQNFPNALQPIIAGMALLDGRIDAVTFTRGLNKTEMMGEGRGADLASIILTVEGRIHKHLNSRFSEHLTVHYKKNLAKIVNISLTDSETSNLDYPEVKTRFRDYLKYYNIDKKDLQLDDTSSMNYGLPSNWIVTARKPDGSGFGNASSYTVELLRPFFSSLPEAGFRYMLARIIADAFGDEDMIQKLLPDEDITKLTSEADIQLAEMQTAILTTPVSDFDREITPEDEVNPNLSDAHKFMSFPASRENDHIVFLQIFLAKVDDAVQRMNRKEFGQTTLHIWLYNLVSSAQAHLQLLRQDSVRGERSEAQQLAQRFGKAFNLLRQVESQANAEKQKKFDTLQKRDGKEARKQS